MPGIPEGYGVRGSHVFRRERVDTKQITIEYVPVDTLEEYYNNPRHNDSAVDMVAASIRDFGFKVPIIIDENNVIVAGHTRLKAAKKLGMTEVPVSKASDLTPEQIQAFRLADNKTQELSTWDFGKLGEELDKIVDIDMGEFGFGSEEMDFSEQDLDDSNEIDLDDFEDEKFSCTCPQCGFKFNED